MGETVCTSEDTAYKWEQGDLARYKEFKTEGVQSRSALRAQQYQLEVGWGKNVSVSTRQRRRYE